MQVVWEYMRVIIGIRNCLVGGYEGRMPSLRGVGGGLLSTVGGGCD